MRVIENAGAAHGIERQSLGRKPRTGRHDDGALDPLGKTKGHLQRLLATHRTTHHGVKAIDAERIEQARVQFGPIPDGDLGKT
jgi:hypothetical protein